jgi:hypothetical protein
MEFNKENQKMFAREVLSKDSILIGYELEDGEFSENRRQVLIRPISQKYFKEIWGHGKKYCSKMIIYLTNGDLFIERRPDQKNYNIKGDPMNQADIIGSVSQLNGAYIDKYGVDSFNDKVSYSKDMSKNRIEWVVEHLIDIKEVGDGLYNIIYQD